MKKKKRKIVIGNIKIKVLIGSNGMEWWGAGVTPSMPWGL